MNRNRPTRYLVIGWLVVVTIITTISILRPAPVLSDTDLTPLVLIPGRIEDPALHDIAHARAYEASLNWSHEGMREGTAEILAFGPDPVAQWFASPPHAAIIADPYWNRVSCGTYDIYAACVFTHAGEPVEVARTPNPTPVGAMPTAGATPEPLVPQASPPVLPDTATRLKPRPPADH